MTRLVQAPRLDFSSLRRELDLPDGFPPQAQAEADRAAAEWDVGVVRPPHAEHAGGPTAVVGVLGTRVDRSDVPLVTIDPPGARDLDQALNISTTPSGYRVHYAIADVAVFVPPGGDLETETWQRGETCYLPDGNVPLHPVVLSEGAASLLPNRVRPAVLWTIDLDHHAETVGVSLERALVRSRAQLTYADVDAAHATGTLPASIAALPEVGQLLRQRGLARGAISLPRLEQELVRQDGDYRLVLRASSPAEQWNEQISLLTGTAAARIMLDGGIGLLRTMPAPPATAVDHLRLVAAGLGCDWPAGESVGVLLSRVEAGDPHGAALVDQAAELLRGAGYTAFAGAPPAQTLHAGVGSPYAHVTAPLRRLADRYATEVCLALVTARPVPDWAASALPRLPEVMHRSGARTGAAQRGAIDLAEASLLRDRVGADFDAVVVDLRPHGVVVVADPPVRAPCQGQLALGERVRARLVSADPEQRTVVFARVP